MLTGAGVPPGLARQCCSSGGAAWPCRRHPCTEALPVHVSFDCRAPPSPRYCCPHWARRCPVDHPSAGGALLGLRVCRRCTTHPPRFSTRSAPLWCCRSLDVHDSAAALLSSNLHAGGPGATSRPPSQPSSCSASASCSAAAVSPPAVLLLSALQLFCWETADASMAEALTCLLSAV